MSITVTQTMINNGGFVIVLTQATHPHANVQLRQWVPLTAPPGITVTPATGLSLTEGGDVGTYNVKLTAAPASDVVVDVSSDNGDVKMSKDGGTTKSSSVRLTFTPSGAGIWSTAQAITVEASEDGNLLDESAVITHSVVAADSSDEYDNVASVTFSVNVMDDDYPGLMITGASASESDETLDFTVRLSMASSRRVTVDWAVVSGGTATPGTASSGDYDSGAASGTLVFGSPLIQTISVPINDDSVSEGDETVKVALGAPSPSQVRVSGSSVATGTIVDDDERTVVGTTSGEFSQGDTTVTVDSTLPADTGLEVVLPTELESGGETIEELTVTLGTSDAEIDADLFGYTGDDADHVLVDVDVSPVPDAAVRICLPVTDGLREAAGERRLYLVRFSGGTWERLSSTVEGEMVCADSSGFSPFAVVYELTNSGSDGRTPSSLNEMNSDAVSGDDGGCAISGENRFASPGAWFFSPVLPAILLMPLLFFGRFRKKETLLSFRIQ